MGNKISLVFTEDIIKFIKLMKVQKFNDSKVGFDNYGLYPESHLFDFMASKQVALEPEFNVSRNDFLAVCVKSADSEYVC